MRALAIVIAIMLTAVSGCAICRAPDDCTYAAYGGIYERTDRCCGRVGSILDPAGVTHAGAMPLPADSPIDEPVELPLDAGAAPLDASTAPSEADEPDEPASPEDALDQQPPDSPDEQTPDRSPSDLPVTSHWPTIGSTSR